MAVAAGIAAYYAIDRRENFLNQQLAKEANYCVADPNGKKTEKTEPWPTSLST
jgi:hypothetical protein